MAPRRRRPVPAPGADAARAAPRARWAGAARHPRARHRRGAPARAEGLFHLVHRRCRPAGEPDAEGAPGCVARALARPRGPRVRAAPARPAPGVGGRAPGGGLASAVSGAAGCRRARRHGRRVAVAPGRPPGETRGRSWRVRAPARCVARSPRCPAGRPSTSRTRLRWRCTGGACRRSRGRRRRTTARRWRRRRASRCWRPARAACCSPESSGSARPTTGRAWATSS